MIEHIEHLTRIGITPDLTEPAEIVQKLNERLEPEGFRVIPWTYGGRAGWIVENTPIFLPLSHWIDLDDIAKWFDLIIQAATEERVVVFVPIPNVRFADTTTSRTVVKYSTRISSKQPPRRALEFRSWICSQFGFKVAGPTENGRAEIMVYDPAIMSRENLYEGVTGAEPLKVFIDQAEAMLADLVSRIDRYSDRLEADDKRWRFSSREAKTSRRVAERRRVAMSSWEQPRDGLTDAEWRRLFARLDRERAQWLYPGNDEPGASYRRALEAADEALNNGSRPVR